MKFTNNDHCCVSRCRMPVVLQYSVHPDKRSFLLCQKHWDRLCDATTSAVWHSLLKQMGYSPEAIRWWIVQKQGTPESADSPNGGCTFTKETEMTKKNTKNKADKVMEPKPQKVGEAWQEVLIANEKAQKSQRMTDEQLSREMNRRFPGRTSFQFTEVAGVQSIRRHYNKGGWNEGTPPKLQSRRFDKKGEPVEVRRGRQPAAIVPVKKNKKAKKATRQTTPIG